MSFLAFGQGDFDLTGVAICGAGKICWPTTAGD
jgi:hypothetical protein